MRPTHVSSFMARMTAKKTAAYTIDERTALRIATREVFNSPASHINLCFNFSRTVEHLKTFTIASFISIFNFELFKMGFK